MTAFAYATPAAGYATLWPPRALGADLAAALYLAKGSAAATLPRPQYAAAFAQSGPVEARRLAAADLAAARAEVLPQFHRGEAMIYRLAAHGPTPVWERIERLSLIEGALLVTHEGLVAKAKFDILSDIDLRAIIKRAGAAMLQADRQFTASALEQYVAAVIDINYPALSPAELARSLEGAQRLLAEVRAGGPEAWAKALNEPLQLVASATRRAVRDRFFGDLAIDIKAPEKAAVERIALQQGWFVRNRNKVRDDALTNRARAIVGRGLEQGLGRTEIGQELAANLPDMWQGMGQRYANTVAAVAVSRARSYVEASTFTEAGVQYAEIQAVLDERTTDVCRFMDGQIIPVSDMMGIAHAAATVSRPEDIYHVSPFMQVRTPEGEEHPQVQVRGTDHVLGTVLRSGVGTADDRGVISQRVGGAGFRGVNVGAPPYHFNCRSYLVPRLDMAQVPSGMAARASASPEPTQPSGIEGGPVHVFPTAGPPPKSRA